MNTPTVGAGPAAGATTQLAPADRELKSRINEFVGLVFYGQLLKAMQNSSLKGEIGHGGRGEEVFAGQLHLELAQRAGKASASPLTQAIYRQLVTPSRRAAATQARTV